ncbi:hypothetical protein IJG04_01245 [Candidatus Saccharibacteria bacterium]|nr:hypothetical protein [Candidatus Saccharibacteria bacterium]
MAKEVAIGKRAKISQAQQYMLLAVLGASVMLGLAVALVQRFVEQISFNSSVIAEEEKAIVSYSDTIKNIGICKKPSGESYTMDELKNCNPDSISAEDVPNTLRYNILEGMANNENLASVPKESTSECINSATGKNYTYNEMSDLYRIASANEDSVQMNSASALIRKCSALRIIPDALPALKNEEALLASLDKIFLVSGWRPDSLSPTGNATVADFGTGLNAISVRLAVEAGTDTTMEVLSNIERSIREFNIERATIEWGSNETLILQAQATAYYMDETNLVPTAKNMKPGGTK